MFILIDIFLVLFICLFTYINYKKGLIEVAYKIFSFFIAIVISLILFNPISCFLTKYTSVDEHINSYISGVVEKQLPNSEKSEAETNVSNIFTNYINKTIEETSKTIKDNISTVVSNNITHTIMNVISFLVVYILTKIILFIVHLTSDTFSKLPIIKQFNEFGGLIYGLVLSFLIIFVVLALFSFLPLPNIQFAIQQTIVTLFLYNINPILILLF